MEKDGDPPNADFNYASVIGMLQYLQAQSQPDITFNQDDQMKKR